MTCSTLRPWAPMPGALLLLSLLSACSATPPTDAPWLTAPDRTSHAEKFPLVGTSHAATDCNACHTGSTFTAVDCTTCHTQAKTDPIHLGAVTGYAWASATCITCHRSGAISPVDHTAHFPIGAGTSHALACAECHGDAARRSDVSTLRCAECHAARPGFAAVHGAVKDFTATSPACLRCHAELPVVTVASHQARFPIAAASPSHTTACLQCHQGLRADKPYAADFAAMTCTACHTQAATAPAHAAVADFRHDSPSCFQCHPGGTAASVAHEARFPIAAGTDHAGITCAECHTDAARRGDVTTLACAACHTQRTPTLATRHTGATIPVVDYAARSASCVRCHAEGQVDRAASHPRGDRTPSGEADLRTAGCSKCHSGFRAAKPWAASWSTTPGCVSCHRNGIPN